MPLFGNKQSLGGGIDMKTNVDTLELVANGLTERPKEAKIASSTSRTSR